MENQQQEQRRGTYRKTRFVEDKYFMDWIGCNLPPATDGFTATDLDLILRDKSGRIMLLETKRKGASMKTHQSITFQILDQALQAIDGRTLKINAFGKKINVPIKYKGFKLLQFENTTFENGRVAINAEVMTEEEVKEVLSMRKSKKK